LMRVLARTAGEFAATFTNHPTLCFSAGALRLRLVDERIWTLHERR